MKTFREILEDRVTNLRKQTAKAWSVYMGDCTPISWTTYKDLESRYKEALETLEAYDRYNNKMLEELEKDEYKKPLQSPQE